MAPNPYLKQYLMTAGPTPVPPAVSQAMATPMLYHRAPAFVELYERVLAKLPKVFQTANDLQIVRAIDRLGVELRRGADQDPVVVADAVQQLLAGPVGAEVDVEALPEHVDAGRGDLLGDEHLVGLGQRTHPSSNSVSIQDIIERSCLPSCSI